MLGESDDLVLIDDADQVRHCVGRLDDAVAERLFELGDAGRVVAAIREAGKELALSTCEGGRSWPTPFA